jgi:hypothetical protein
MSESSISTEVRKFIADKIDNGETIVVAWLANEFVSSKSGIEGDDVEFYRDCAILQLKGIVRACVGTYDAKPVVDAQLTLDGFEYLQCAYSVTRADQVVLVPVKQLSDSELLGRADEYDLMAKGCRAHAREIRSYIASRASEAIAS